MKTKFIKMFTALAFCAAVMMSSSAWAGTPVTCWQCQGPMDYLGQGPYGCRWTCDACSTYWDGEHDKLCTKCEHCDVQGTKSHDWGSDGICSSCGAAKPPVVTITAAKQRWPWNGKIDVTLNASAFATGRQYKLGIVLKDGDKAYTNETDAVIAYCTATNGIKVVVDTKAETGWTPSTPEAKLYAGAQLVPVLLGKVQSKE